MKLLILFFGFFLSINVFSNSMHLPSAKGENDFFYPNIPDLCVFRFKPKYSEVFMSGSKIETKNYKYEGNKLVCIDVINEVLESKKESKCYYNPDNVLNFIDGLYQINEFQDDKSIQVLYLNEPQFIKIYGFDKNKVKYILIFSEKYKKLFGELSHLKPSDNMFEGFPIGEITSANLDRYNRIQRNRRTAVNQFNYSIEQLESQVIYHSEYKTGSISFYTEYKGQKLSEEKYIYDDQSRLKSIIKKSFDTTPATTMTTKYYY